MSEGNPHIFLSVMFAERSGSKSSDTLSVESIYLAAQPEPTLCIGAPNMATNRASVTEKTAVQKAFETFDIVEEILLYLPVSHILLDRKVNPTFAEVVNRSIHVRRALFLSPSNTDTMLDIPCGDKWKQGVNGTKVTPILNPFLNK